MAMIDDSNALYEQLKKVFRETWDFGDSEDFSSNFILACKACGQAFSEKAKMGVVEAHFDVAHPDADGEIELDLIWIGEGMPPKSGK
jgi:hypothetical protein